MEADGVGQFGFGTWKSDFHWSIPVSCRLTDQGRCAMKLLFANLCIPKQSSDFTLFFLFVWPEGALTVGAPRFSSMLEESPSSPKLASRSVRSTNVWTGREPNLQPPISSCRVSQQFHEACGWNLTERSELAPEKLVSLWAFTSLHQRTPGVIWKDRSLWHPVKEKKLLFFSKLQDEEHTVCLP